MGIRYGGLFIILFYVLFLKNAKSRSNLECDFSSNTQSDLNSESQPFKGMELVKVSRVTLTGNDRESDQKKSVLFKPSPMTIETFKVFLRSRP